LPGCAKCPRFKEPCQPSREGLLCAPRMGEIPGDDDESLGWIRNKVFLPTAFCQIASLFTAPKPEKY